MDICPRKHCFSDCDGIVHCGSGNDWKISAAVITGRIKRGATWKDDRLRWYSYEYLGYVVSIMQVKRGGGDVLVSGLPNWKYIFTPSCYFTPHNNDVWKFDF